MHMKPSEEEIARVMKEFGFDRLVAYRHLQSRYYALQLARRSPQYPLGKSQHFA